MILYHWYAIKTSRTITKNPMMSNNISTGSFIVESRESSIHLYNLLKAIKPPAITRKNQFLSRNSLFKNALAFMMFKLVFFQTTQFLYTKYNPIIASITDQLFESIDIISRFSYMISPSIKFYYYICILTSLL